MRSEMINAVGRGSICERESNGGYREIYLTEYELNIAWATPLVERASLSIRRSPIDLQAVATARIAIPSSLLDVVGCNLRNIIPANIARVAVSRHFLGR
jgi:hypothetical protein